MGAMAVLAYLSRPGADRPIDPHGLVLLASAAGKLTERGLGRLLQTPARAALCRFIDRVPGPAVKAMTGPLGATLGHRYGRDHAQRATLAALAARALAATTPVCTIAGFLTALSHYDQYHTLDTIRAHTVVVSGGADLLTPCAHSEDLAAGIAGAEHVHLPGIGHMLPQEAPAVVNDVIRRVISANHSPTPADAEQRGVLRC
jgi:pimeloyl-ACP methyl ester carboxylesterase